MINLIYRKIRSARIVGRSLLAALIACSASDSYAQQTFNHPFAPSENFVKPSEKPYRDAVSLNGSWRFFPVADVARLPVEKLRTPEFPAETGWAAIPVKVPSPWNVNSFARGDGSGGDFLTYPSYPRNWEMVKAGWLSRKLPYDRTWKGKRIIIRFDAVGGYTQVYINRKKVAVNFDPFLPFEADITDELKEGTDNEVLVWVADGQLFNKPGKYGKRTFVAGSFWGQHAIGIWQDVTLIARPSVAITDTYIKPLLDQHKLIVQSTIVNEIDAPANVSISGDVSPWINKAGKGVIEAPEPKWALETTVLHLNEKRIRLEPRSTITITQEIPVDNILKEWSPDHPELYGLIVTLTDGKKPIDRKYTRFGWRQFSINGTQVQLNGHPIVFKGDSWHFMGIPQMTRRYAWAWFRLLKDSHANAVRLHAQPYPSFYLDMADEMGICVLDETGMWASDGGPKLDGDDYWKSSDEHMRRLVLRDRNHPGVFGWSVCNENLPVTIGVFHSPDSLVKKQVAQINKWIAITKELDPTRTWISGDGETQAEFDSPVVIGHYGGSDENYRNLSSKGKPWGIGEAGMAYYATPQQTAVYNGNRSYASQLGRIEAVADEATKLINMFKKYNASYMSIFNIVWYGVKPLELGLKDTTKAPLPTDGVFFGAYRENEPGVQPERLGPYTTTLNPGYDPALPLYRAWPLQTAISASFATNNILPESNRPAKNPDQMPPAADKQVRVLSSDKDSLLVRGLIALGVSVNPKARPEKSLLIIDGLHPLPAKILAKYQKEQMAVGGRMLIWGVDYQSLENLNPLLPYRLSLTDRKATSFIPKGHDPLLNGLDNADFYFSEIADKPVMTTGLSGEIINHADVLLDASNTNWKTWNKQAEYLKTAALIRSEREFKPEGKALIAWSSDRGRTYLLGIASDHLTAVSANLVRKMLLNLNVIFGEKSVNSIPAVGPDGHLDNALLLASLDAGKDGEKESSTADKMVVTVSGPFIGTQTLGRFWDRTTAAAGTFDFSKMQFDGPKTHATAYLSFWLYCPYSLSNLLLQPDLPRLDAVLSADDGYVLYLNGKAIKTSASSPETAKIGALPLEKGWNRFTIKVIQKEGAWKFAMQFLCDKPEFIKELKSQISH